MGASRQKATKGWAVSMGYHLLETRNNIKKHEIVTLNIDLNMSL